MDKFRKHIRHKKHNYCESADYFITICSHNFANIFSQIQEEKILLTLVGEIIQQCWQQLPIKFTGIKSGEFVIMPNHFHGIISIRQHLMIKKVHLGTIIRFFKSMSSRIVNDSIWQINYYEQIIKDEYHYYFVEEYILSNPANWEKDKLYRY